MSDKFADVPKWSPPKYTQEMRINHEPCPYCGNWHTSMGCAPQNMSVTMHIKDLEETISRLRSLVAELIEDAERLVANYAMYTPDGLHYCVHCGSADKYASKIIHDPDCSITLHRQLMKKIEEEK